MSAVAFRLTVRLCRLPPVWPFSSLLELNLRTYVRCRDEAGILFLSMHADNRLSIAAARILTPLPYTRAHIEYRAGRLEAGPFPPRVSPTIESQDFSFLASTRSQSLLTARFTPLGVPKTASLASLEGWLVERYLAFVPDRRGRLRKMAVAHAPWQLQEISLALSACQLAERQGIDLPLVADLWHFSPGVSATISPFLPCPTASLSPDSNSLSRLYQGS